MTRSDIHSPKNFDPAEYTYAGFVDEHFEDGFADIEDERMNTLPMWRDTTDRCNGCDHCGQSGQRYLAFFIHEPTQQVVVTGTRCAMKLSLASRDQLDAKKHAEANARRVKLAAFLAADPKNQECYDFLNEQIENGNHGYGGFYFDLLHKCNRWGSLSEKQVDAALRGMVRDAEYAAKRAAEDVEVTAEFPSGRQTIQGTCLAAKTVDGFYGDTFKWLVKMDDGNKVWGSVPAAIDAPPKGRRIEFAAAFEVSEDDPHFGFYKRPTKCRFLDEEEA